MKVLITGARSGIGYAAALELLKRGHFVYLTVHTDDQLKTLMEIEELKDKNVVCFKLDITNEKDRKIVKEIDIDVLINNAAIGIGGSIIEADINKIRENFEVNYFGTIQLTQVLLEDMVKRDSGRILMVTSILSEMPFPWLGIYSSTKAALKNISIALDKELKHIKSNVKVVIIEPGFYKTGFNDVMMENKYDNKDSYLKYLESKIRKDDQIKLNLLQSNDLSSIVDKIVKGVEEENSKLIYKAPFIQSTFEKAYIITKK